MGSYRFGPFLLNRESRTLLRDGAPVQLTAKVLETLLVLVENRFRVLDKDELLSSLWPDTVVEEANLVQNVSTLRKALGDNPRDRRYIATVPGRGYTFVAEVTAIPKGTGAPGLPQVLAASPPPAAGPRSQTFWLAGLAILIPLTGLLALSIYRTAEREDPPALHPLPFTSLPGLEYQPAFSPDGRQLAYVASNEQEDGSSIYVKLIGAGTQIKLTSAQGHYACPGWSPDGRFIAFWRQSSHESGYYMVSALGGPERRITAGSPSTYCSGLDWFPDGRQLVIAESSKATEASPLIAVNVDTGERRNITSPPAGSLGDANPAVSPDGKLLAFARWTAVDATELYVMPVAGGPARRLLADSTTYFKISWTADSRDIVYSSAKGGCCSIWRTPIAGGSSRPVLSGGQELTEPVVSRQGGRLAYALSNVNANVWTIDVSHVKTGLPSRRPLISSTRRQSDPQYSPDGTRIAFWSDRSGSNEIWVSGAAGETPVQLTNFGGPHTGSPRWSPDGSRIVFDSRPGGNPDIFVVRADGGAPRRITTHTAEDVVPSWSRDGKWIYFTSNRGGEFEIWKMAAGDSETAAHLPVQVTRGGGFGAFESSDGLYLYYARSRGKPGLWRMPLSGSSMGREEPVIKSLQHWGWWTLASGRIYYFESSDTLSGDHVHLKALDLAARTTRDLAVLDRPVSGGNPVLSVSPDGSTLAYSQVDKVDSDIMLVENFK